MGEKAIRPNWWLLYLLLPFMAALAWLDSRLVISTNLHKAFEIGAVMCIGWLANRWISANRLQLMHEGPHEQMKVTLVHGFDEEPLAVSQAKGQGEGTASVFLEPDIRQQPRYYSQN